LVCGFLFGLEKTPKQNSEGDSDKVIGIEEDEQNRHHGNQRDHFSASAPSELS